MNSNVKKSASIIGGVIAILALPVLFFGFMSGSFTSFAEPAERTIAVVNEDLGSEREEQKIEMGKEVLSILSEDSDYNWEVTGRGAAESGLKSNRYDAVLYIPSDFSSNVMSYDEQNPQKAEFNYTIQQQKNADSKKNALKEIERATDRVNGRISTMYWSYVAIEMDHIKKEFASILDKESEFLDAMVAYYDPGSSELADVMQRQREQMEQLRETVEGASDQDHAARVDHVEAFKNELSGFLQDVQSYQAFQVEQRGVLEELQSDNIAKIQEMAAGQAAEYEETVRRLKENNGQLAAELEKVNKQIALNQEKFNDLEQVRLKQAERQAEEILALQGTAIDEYNDTLIGTLQKNLKDGAGSKIPDAPVVDGLPDITDFEAIKAELERLAKEQEKEEPAPPEQPEPEAPEEGGGLPSLEEEKETITALAASIDGLKQQIAEEQPESEIPAQLDELSGKLSEVNESIGEKEEEAGSEGNGKGNGNGNGEGNGNGNGEAEDKENAVKVAAGYYSDLYSAYESLLAIYSETKLYLEEYPENTVAIVREIERKEAGLLQLDTLSPERKKELKGLFKQAPAAKDLDSLLAYYATLEQMAFTLDDRKDGRQQRKDEVLKDEIINTLTKNIAALKEEEKLQWAKVSEGLPETGARVEEWNSSFTAIVSGYEESVGMQHMKLLENLQSIGDQADSLLAQLRDPATRLQESEPEVLSNEGELVSDQQNIGMQLVSLSSTVSEVSERQDSIVNYARELQGKAEGFESATDSYSEKWRQNLEAITAFSDDVSSFLDNTYVDGQENGYVFDHFTNPLSVRGEAIAGEEMKKVPPAILYVILLISSLAIGFFSHKMREGTPLLRTGMLALLGGITGLIISLYSVNMYALNDQRAIEWTLFTILIVIAGSALISTALDSAETAGWIAAIALICLYIAPLLKLGVPEADIPDILSPVYMSIKYDPVTLFDSGAAIAGIAAVVLLIAAWLVKRWRTGETVIQEESYES
ncbi:MULTISPECIES: type VII secretion protein EsaA [Bhargavaea]|uniref:Type VII secretion protein EsaA n=1 Tax=Bhargavaea changchunensis TaxID=2134037 RepID=A0ABW2NCY5_9BACL|nr:type VII secretion protein EsaA [Bhargavaea sp. CC-171006]